MRSLTINDLPDELIIYLLSLARETERARYGSPAVVCRRWRQLAVSPVLLRHLHLELDCSSSTLLPRLRSLRTWMVKYGAVHVQDLFLEVAADDVPEGAPEESEAQALLNEALAACASGGGLQKLELHFRLPMRVGSWLAAMSGLHTLRLVTPNMAGVIIEPSLHPLTMLEVLELNDVELAQGISLPPSLTHARICGAPHDFPWQLGSLPRLQGLQLEDQAYDPEAYEPLTRITSLKRLQLEENAFLPGCLSRLSQLEALSLGPVQGQGGVGAPGMHGEPASLAELLNASLAPLTQLTCLHLCLWGAPAASADSATVVPDFPAAALAGLHQLQHFAMDVSPVTENPAPELVLPSGAWLGSLQYISLPLHVAACSLTVLSGARQLQHLHLKSRLESYADHDADIIKVLEWAVARPQLRHMPLTERCSAAVLEAAASAVQRNPSLRVFHARRGHLELCLQGQFFPKPMRELTETLPTTNDGMLTSIAQTPSAQHALHL